VIEINADDNLIIQSAWDVHARADEVLSTFSRLNITLLFTQKNFFGPHTDKPSLPQKIKTFLLLIC
jgi:hypothetical protein